MNRRQSIDFHPKRLEDLPLWAPAPTPEQRKAEGQARAWDNAGEWREEATQCVREFLLTLPDGAEVMADEWRDAVPIEPPPDKFNAWGALAGNLARWQWIVWTGGYTNSKRDKGHSNVVKRWRVNRAAVLRGVPSKERRVAA